MTHGFDPQTVQSLAVSLRQRDVGVRAIETTATVTADGKLTEDVPPDVPAGEHRVVLVFDGDQTDDEAGELVKAAATTLDFWDNPYDDEDWNDA